MVKSVRLVQDEQGTRSVLDLARPDAFLVEPTLLFEDDPANFGGLLEPPP
jgi:hypothetical protein